MLESLVQTVKEAGAFAFLNIGAGGLGLALALVTLGLTATKSNAAKVTSVLCLAGVLMVLGVGLAGYELGMVGTTRALGNVPEDQRDLLLRKGMEESRANFTVALGAALLPLLAGLLAAARTRFRAGLILAVVALAAYGATAAQLARPLPSADPLFVEPRGLALPGSISPRRLSAAALIALTPEGLWANGKQVPSFAAALEEPLVRERNRSSLPLLVDGRVKFSALADVIEAASAADRHQLQLVVLSPTGERKVIEIADLKSEWPAAEGRPPLLLTVSIGQKAFTVGATGGTLPALPPDMTALNDKLAEIKAAFPNNESVRVTAEPEIPLEVFVKALDAVSQREKKLLNGQLVVGRFTLPKPAAGP